MAKRWKRAFTITELVIVIAVVAILAAVLIPTFANVIKKADESADTQIVREMNTALSMGSAEGNPDSIGEVLDILLEEGGFDMAKVNPSSEGYLYAWEKASNQILLLNEKGEVVYSNRAYDTADWELYVPVGNNTAATALNVFSGKANVYVSEDLTFDFKFKNAMSLMVAEGKTLTGSVTLGGSAAASATISGQIDGALVVNNAAAEVSHYGMVESVDLQAVASNSYHEYGTVPGTFTVTTGRVVVEEGAVVSEITVPAAAQNVKILSNASQNVVVTTESSSVTIEEGAGKVFVGGSQASGVAGSGAITVQEVGDKASLKAAMQTNSYVRLTQNLVFTTADIIDIPAEAAVVLDMNGKSITVESDFEGHPFVNNGTLTVTGNGTIDSSASSKNGKGAIENYGTLLIEDGNYRGAYAAGGSVIRNMGKDAVLIINDGIYEEAPVAVFNEGTATINGGSYTGTTCSACDRNYWSYTIRNTTVDSYMIINGGTFIGTQGAVSAAIGTLIVNDGYFKSVVCENNHTGAVFYALYAAGEAGRVRCVINGGTFETEGNVTAVSIGNDNSGGDGGIKAPATGEIYGGTFIAPAGVDALRVADVTGTPFIFGGSYTKAFDEKYLMTGYEFVQEGNYYVVRATA